MDVRIKVTEEEITVENDSEIEPFAWRSIEEIVAFRRDFGTWDDIRLGFRVRGQWIEFSESLEGWNTLTEMMATKFSTIPADWYFEVMFPPFETNFRVLYSRGSEVPERAI